MLRLIDDAALEGAPPGLPEAGVVESYRWLLARVGDGVRLTQAGHLPPALVAETLQHLGWADDWIGKPNREDQTLPVLDLRDSAQRLGLLRKHRGTLLPTVAGRRVTDDPAGLWQHLAARLPVARNDPERDAGLLYLLTVAAARPEPGELLAEGLTVLGWSESGTGRPTAGHAFELARPTRTVFDRLGLLGRRRRPDPVPPPTPGAVALARAALLAPPDEQPAPAAVPRPPTTQGVDGPAVELNVTLRHTRPRVWRRLAVPPSLTLRELHAVLQTAMGWEDYHLHLFEIDGVFYGDVEDFPGELGDEETTTVGDVAARASRFRYEYDFGDGWEHDLRIGRRPVPAGSDRPRCLGGARACPPEDCGGVPGYQHLLELLADPAGAEDEDAELLEWLGDYDPDAFDATGIDELLELYDRHTRQRRRR
jgi:hypothetical protein